MVQFQYFFRVAILFALGLVVASCGPRGRDQDALTVRAELTLRAASKDPVPGWERMEFPAGGPEAIWVAPMPSLTLADVKSAEATKDEQGRRAVALRFTAAGAEKMRELSKAQIRKLIAIVLNDKLISAPTVMSEVSSNAIVTGGFNELTQEDFDAILHSANHK